MDELVRRLSSGDHPIEASLRPVRNARELKTRLDMGYVHIRFTDTQNGTELGVKVDPVATDQSEANFDAATGVVRIVGSLSLNFVPVRCRAELDLATLTGKGHLELIA
jgi:hypothetical protein